MVANFPLTLSKGFLEAIHSESPSDGYTHTFYRYPARFSPEFARAAILSFSKPSEVVLDPFMGSGTSLVESMALGRDAIGTDINPLAQFVAQVKTTILPEKDLRTIASWQSSLSGNLNLRLNSSSHHDWTKEGYQKDLPWHIRKTIELTIDQIDDLPKPSQRRLARCALLRTAQWALDCTTKFPTAEKFRAKYDEVLCGYFHGLSQLRMAVSKPRLSSQPRVICLDVPAAELTPSLWQKKISKKPGLVVTSPPYPNVHVLYHRWQIFGRRETPSPFWIINRRDGRTQSHYTMGSRSPFGNDQYFEKLEQSFSVIHDIIKEKAIVVQLVAFSHLQQQLPRYLQAMELAGFREVDVRIEDKTSQGRIWRKVPLRKWYATYKGNTSSSQELLLVHQKS